MAEVYEFEDLEFHQMDSSGSEDSFGDEVSDWLNEKDISPCKNTLKISDKENSSPNVNDGKKIGLRKAAYGSNIQILVTIPDSVYIKEHLNEFSALCEVEDLDFISKSVAEQENIIRTMDTRSYSPGEYVFQMGDTTDDFYIVVSDQKHHKSSHVEVLRDGRVLTRLYRGQYFGQMQFLTKQPRTRNASVRVPITLHHNVKIARITSSHFEQWTFFRTMLIVRAVPFLNQLPLAHRIELLNLTQVKHFSVEECIIKQGDAGDCFYILLDGSVRVVEDLQGGTSEQLAVLRSGHCFGEMALANNEPRVANIYSLDASTCLMLTKEAFQKALTVDAFSKVLNDLLQRRRRTRRHRETVRRPTQGSGQWDDILHLSQSIQSVDSESISCSDVSVLGVGDAPSMNKGLTLDSVGVVSESPASAAKRNSFNEPNSNGKVAGGGRMSISDNAVLAGFRTPTRPTRRTLSEPLDAPVTETKTLSVSKLETGDRCVNGKYALEREIGKGSFGDVWQVLDLTTQRQYAMKTLHRNPGPSNQAIDTRLGDVSFEISVMKKLRNDYVVRLVEVIDDPKSHRIYIVQELMEGPLLPDTLLSQPLSPALCRGYFRDIVRGVHYLHAQGIVHRDIKPQNIMISRGRAKIGDLGAAVFTGGHERSKFHGTPAYTAPELNLSREQRSHNFSLMPCIDLFAMGATLYCMSVGHPPWMADTEIGLADKIQHLEPRMPPQMDPHLRYLVLRLLEKDWTRRADMDAVVCDAWVTDEGSDPLFDDFHLDEEDDDEEEEAQSINNSNNDIIINSFRFEQTNVSTRRTKPVRTAQQESPSLAASPALAQPYNATANSSLLDFDVTPLTEDYECGTQRVAVESFVGTPHSEVGGASKDSPMEMSKSSSRSHQSRRQSYLLPAAEKSLDSSFHVLRPAPLAERTGTVARRRQRRQASLLASIMLVQRSHNQLVENQINLNGTDSKDLNQAAPDIKLSPVRLSEQCDGDAHVVQPMRFETQEDSEQICDISQVDESYDSDMDDTKSTSSSSSNESEYGAENCEYCQELEDIFDPLCEKALPGVAAWDCVVGPDGRVSEPDTARGCVSPLPGSNSSDGTPCIVAQRMAHLDANADCTSHALGVRYAVARTQGARSKMEDRCVGSWGIRNQQQPYALFGLFDGHGGDAASEVLCQSVGSVVKEFLNLTEQKTLHNCASDLNTDTKLVLQATCAKLDHMLLSKDFKRLQSRRRASGGRPSLTPQSHAGSTGQLLFLEEIHISQNVERVGEMQPTAIKLTLANIGDCRAVLSSRGQCRQLSTDHKPRTPEELQRILTAGGQVANGRVSGTLAVSRAFGDMHHKTIGQNILAPLNGMQVLPWATEYLWGPSQVITSEPQIVEVLIGPDDEFVLAATDGLWDLLSNEAAINCVRFQLLTHGNLEMAAQELLKEAEMRAGPGGADNMTVLLCAVNQVFAGL